ncbi:MAG: exodeoxyribonuclease VII small subunit [Deltaproteobacteria bacterium]|nr:exodeoxyribonuclease VII small subunit [Deltaproteobacteria bacterium]
MSEENGSNLTFEKGLARLEELVHELESDDLNLDKSLELFEEGIKLTRSLNRKLDEAEKKLEVLSKDNGGEPMAEDLDINPDQLDEN